MPREIYLVKVGMTMTEGMVSEWFIADGAKVKKGEMLYSLETEKVNLDVDAEMDGYVKHTAEAGVMLAPGDVVGYIFPMTSRFLLILLGLQALPQPLLLRRQKLRRQLLLSVQHPSRLRSSAVMVG